MFREVSPKVNFPQMEERVLRFWKENDIFRKSLALREKAPRYVFYEGPPTANGLPGTHHVLARVFKDLFPRYKTMKGYYCLRKGGWDTHGLPVELEVEKELGITKRGKRAIEEYGIAKFNAKCKESVFRYVKEWEELTARIAFWIDMENAYVTLSNEYIESVWWILRQLWDKELIYQGYKVVPYCPRCGTPLSDHEVALGYAETEDPSVYVKFPVREDEPLVHLLRTAQQVPPDEPEPGIYFLGWTTTPWTLPGNAALAVHPEAEYVVVEQTTKEGVKEWLILARDLLDEALEGPYTVLQSLSARELAGTHYLPLYTFLPAESDCYFILTADFVNTDEGTGIVHMAPAFGAEDLEVGKEYNLPVFHTVDLNGAFIDEVTPWRGLFVKDADPWIIKDLQRRGLVYRVGTYRHVYPFCWRCDTPLLYYAKTTWYIETTRYKDRLVELNRTINWYPGHIRDGRFGNWLENNVDWALGRERYWGTPLPIWECERCRHQECIGSLAELEEKVGRSLKGLDLHRPYIDEVTYPCPECEGTMRRVPEVIDCWFDSGAMPVAQWHYPFENRELFREQFPADFICEAVDQTRGWFYSLHAIATMLFDSVCYKNVICLGLILDEKGEKMSKSRGNVVDPWEVINAHGADALRWYLFTASPPGADRRFSLNLVGEVVRKFLLTLWNTYSFFVTYANIDGWVPQSSDAPLRYSPLDRWILSELHSLIRRVTEALDNYDVTGAARPIAQFVDDLSNWYVRRSRRRFWKSERDEDKQAAYATLYQCLVTLCGLLAPFTPFIAEEMYQNLVRSVNKEAPESVHLTDFPVADEKFVDEKLMKDTRLVMRVASLGLAARNKAGIKVRQPLSRVLIKVRDKAEEEALQGLADQLREELNVKAVTFIEDVAEVVNYRLNPVASLLGKKYGPLYPAIRAALERVDATQAARTLLAGGELTVEADGREVTLLPEEVEVQVFPKEGYAMAEEAGYLVAVDTTLTPELIREGLARELVRHIQNLRKEADFRIEDRIITYYQAGPTLKAMLEEFEDYVKRETLSLQLIEGEPPEGSYKATLRIEGEEITLGLLRPEA